MPRPKSSAGWPTAWSPAPEAVAELLTEAEPDFPSCCTPVLAVVAT